MVVLYSFHFVNGNGKFYNPTYSSRYRCYFMYFRSSIDHPRQTIDFYYSLIGLMVLFLFWEPNVYNKTIMISGNYNSKRSWAGWCDFSHGLYNQLTHIHLLSMIEKKTYLICLKRHYNGTRRGAKLFFWFFSETSFWS